MADENKSSENRANKKTNFADNKCKICNKKVVNGVTCIQCEDVFHFKCAERGENKDIKSDTWTCGICVSGNNLEKSFSYEDVNTNLSESEIQFLIKENILLKKLMKEIEEKNTLLKEKIIYLSRDCASAVFGDNLEVVNATQDQGNSKGANQNKKVAALPAKSKVKTVDKKLLPDKTKINNRSEVSTISTKQKENETKNHPVNSKTDLVDSDGFQEVRRRRKQKRTTNEIIGSKISQDIFQAAPKMAWFFLGKVIAGTTSEKIIKYLKGQIADEEFICEEIKNAGINSCFKIGANFNIRGQLEDPSFWPNGVVIRRYIFRRRASTQYSK